MHKYDNVHIAIYIILLRIIKPCIWQNVEGSFIATIKLESEHSKSLEPSIVGKRRKNTMKLN